MSYLFSTLMSGALKSKFKRYVEILCLFLNLIHIMENTLPFVGGTGHHVVYPKPC